MGWRRVLGRLGLTLLGAFAVLTLAAAAYDWGSAGTVPVPPLDDHGHTVRAGGLTTHYEQWGESGPPIVLVHGFMESAQVWDRVGPQLAAAGHRVYALDVRGFGYTERRGPYTLTGDTAQLRAFVAALHLDAAHHSTPMLVGHSSGAAIVGDLARTDPAAVRRVVFMDGDGTPYGVGPGWVHHLFVDPYATAMLRLATRHTGLAERAYASGCGPTCPPFDAQQWLTPLRVPGAESALKAILSQPLIGLTYAQERQVHVPAAVVYGSRDPQMGRASATATAARLHTHDVVAIPGAGHLVMLAAPDAVSAVLQRLSR
ncbi:MAG: alpha/beta fold hydrolase [Oryzihumus sp.]